MGTDDPINTRPDGWAALPGRHHERTTRGRSVGHRRAPLRFPIGTSMDHALRDARTRKRMLEAAQCAIEGHARDEVLLVEVLLGRDPNALACAASQLPGILRWMRGCALDAADAEGVQQCTDLLTQLEDQHRA